MVAFGTFVLIVPRLQSLDCEEILVYTWHIHISKYWCISCSLNYHKISVLTNQLMLFCLEHFRKYLAPLFSITFSLITSFVFQLLFSKRNVESYPWYKNKFFLHTHRDWGFASLWKKIIEYNRTEYDNWIKIFLT